MIKLTDSHIRTLELLGARLIRVPWHSGVRLDAFDLEAVLELLKEWERSRLMTCANKL